MPRTILSYCEGLRSTNVVPVYHLYRFSVLDPQALFALNKPLQYVERAADEELSMLATAIHSFSGAILDWTG